MSPNLILGAALAVDAGHPIHGAALIDLCKAFGGRDWLGHFDHPIGTPEGRHERVVALCFAAAMAEEGDL